MSVSGSQRVDAENIEVGDKVKAAYRDWKNRKQTSSGTVVNVREDTSSTGMVVTVEITSYDDQEVEIKLYTSRKNPAYLLSKTGHSAKFWILNNT